MDEVYPGELLTLSATLAVAIATDLTDEEIETVINFFNLTTNNLVSALQQRTINKKRGQAVPVIPIIPDGD